MVSLLDTLGNVNSNQKYSISINGVSLFSPVSGKRINLKNVSLFEKSLLDFELIKIIEEDITALRFKGETTLTTEEIVSFLFKIQGKPAFKPTVMKLVLRKTSEGGMVLGSLEKVNSTSEMFHSQLNYLTISKDISDSVAVLGDFFFEDFDSYQKTLQDYYSWWIGE